ncbi:hypothetical protein AWB80_01324 [Caballeronia pedi]|uniref:Zorya protein ZorC EH domain-containing protein n=1 Tax=Caballeronia pedi TaxID=1777141 RepID=A0A157ZUS7_9BURK|nr:EH signature domain-containing protein [Caballeronia pedi]SAK49261.1 hypothetical protein AWB80_01324 [Caballeronia pedi]
MSFLEILQARLESQRNNTVQMRVSTEPLQDQINELTTQLKGRLPKTPPDAIANAVERFRQDRRIRDSHDALLVSHGCDRPFGQMRFRLIEDRERFPAVRSSIDRFRKYRLVFRDCYKGLLDTYLGYHPEMRGASGTGRPNWEMLRSWLDTGAKGLRDPDGIEEEWVPELAAHPELFSSAPVDAFALQVLKGNEQAFLQFQQALRIERTSWLLEQVILAQVRAAAKVGIMPYIAKLLPLLERLGTQNPAVFNQGLVEVLTAYCADSGGALHGALRDFSLHFWGNPLSLQAEKKTGWATVPLKPRNMVKNWFNLHVIQQFFDVLAKQDKSEPRDVRKKRERRRDFWSKYADVVGEVKFALGPDARSSQDPAMVEVRQLMEGMTLNLQNGGSSQNNAFFMQFKDWVVAEFGHENNACFIYRASDIPFEDGDTAISAQAIRHHINSSFSNGPRGPVRLLHKDGSYENWEDVFEQALRDRGTPMPVPMRQSDAASTHWSPQVSGDKPKKRAVDSMAAQQEDFGWPSADRSAAPVIAGNPVERVADRVSSAGQNGSARAWRNPSISRPSTGDTGSPASATPATSASTSNGLIDNLPFGATQEKELFNVCREYDIPVRDMRERTGHLWVVLDRPDDIRMTPLLQAYGFKYRPGRGWWRQALSRPSADGTAGSQSAPASPAASNVPIANLPFGAKQEKELFNLCRHYDIFVRDMRGRTSYLWVVLDQPEDSRITPLLQAYGFKYRPGQGWWRQA